MQRVPPDDFKLWAIYRHMSLARGRAKLRVLFVELTGADFVLRAAPCAARSKLPLNVALPADT